MSKKVLIASATAHKDGCKTLLGKSVNYHELTKPSGVELVFKKNLRVQESSKNLLKSTLKESFYSFNGSSTIKVLP